MKKVLSLIILMFVMSTFVACSNEVKEEQSQVNSSSTESKIEISEPEISEVKSETSKNEVSTPVIMNTEKVIEAYKEFSSFDNFWYRGGNVEASTMEVIKFNNMDYCRYEKNSIKDYKSFEEKALSLMNNDLFQERQSTIEYIDRDGALYGPVSFGTNGNLAFAGIECEAVQLAQESFEITVDHYYYASEFIDTADEDETVIRGRTIMLYEKTGDDKWVFTSYEYTSIDPFGG